MNLLLMFAIHLFTKLICTPCHMTNIDFVYKGKFLNSVINSRLWSMLSGLQGLATQRFASYEF